MTAGTTVTPGLYIFGFGGHARSVADVAVASGFKRLVFIDAGARPNESFGGFPAVASLGRVEPGWLSFVALGNAAKRRALAAELVAPLATLIAPSASIGVEAAIEDGVLVAHHAHVGPGARIGRCAIINTGAIVDHESTVGAFAHIAIGAIIAGRCRVGDNSMIGAGATLIDGVTVGDDIIVGAGATVTADLIAAGTYVGTPARRLERT